MKKELVNFLVACALGSLIGGSLVWNLESLWLKILGIVAGGLVSAIVLDPQNAREIMKEQYGAVIKRWNGVNWYKKKWQWARFLFLINNIVSVAFIAECTWLITGSFFWASHVVAGIGIFVVSFVSSEFLYLGDSYKNIFFIKDTFIGGVKNKKETITYCLKFWNPFMVIPSVLYYVFWKFFALVVVKELIVPFFASLLIIVYESRNLTCLFSGAFGASLALFTGNPGWWITGGLVAGYLQHVYLAKFFLAKLKLYKAKF